MSKSKKNVAVNDADDQARANAEYYYYARDNGHEDFCKNAKKIYDYVKGRQWNEADVSKLKSQGRPHVTINQLKPTYANIMGEYLSSRADVMFRPVKNGMIEVAAALDKLWVHIANTNRLDATEAHVVSDGVLTGRGYFDIRIDFDDQMRGEVRLGKIRPMNVLLDPETDTDDCRQWRRVTESKFVSLADIEDLYGEEAAERVKHVSPNSCLGPDMLYEHIRPDIKYEGADLKQTRMYRLLSSQYRKSRKLPHFVDVITGDLRRIPEGWDRNRIAAALEYAQGHVQVVDRIVSDVYWCQSVDRVSLHDDWSPYKNFTIVNYFPFFMDGEPIGIFNDLLGPQDMLNKISSQELHILNTTASSGWLIKHGSLVGMSKRELEKRGAETGIVIEYAGENAPEKITPNTVPTGHDRLSMKAGENIKEISGVTDTMRGMDREDVSSKAILAKQARGAVGLALPFTNINRTRQTLAEISLDLIQEYYIEERVLQITGGSVVRPTTETLEINKVTPEGTIVNDLTVGEYAVVVVPTEQRSTTDESDFAQLLQLRELGIPIPDTALVLASNAPNKVELATTMAGGHDTAQDAQAQAQFERQQAEIEAMALESENRKRMADAALSEARAAKAQGEAMLLQDELMLEAEKVKEDTRNKRTQALLQAESLRVQREKNQQDAVMGAAKMQADERKSERDAKAKSAAAKNKPAAKKPTPKRKS